MLEIGLLGSLLAGVLSLLSPCSALLLPAFFAYAFRSVTQLVARTGVFFCGLAAVLVPVGTGLGGIGGLFNQHREAVITAGGAAMVVLGIFIALGGGFTIPGLGRLSQRVRGDGYVSVFLLGCVYGFAGFCAGPLLGAVLTTAAVSGSLGYGALTMLSYALGMTIPLFVLAAAWDRFDLGRRPWLRGRPLQLGPIRTNSLSVLAGALFVGIGVLFIFSHGTILLPSPVGTEEAFAAQEWVAHLADHVPDAWVACAVSGLAAAAVGIKAARTPAPAPAG